MISNAASFETVARLACGRIGWDYDSLTTEQWRLLRSEISAALKWAWERYWWEDVMHLERVQLRPSWDQEQEYGIGDEVYHEDSDAYYTAIWPSEGQAPASLGSDGKWATNLRYWARVDETEEVDQGTWALDTDYEVGDRVSWGGATKVCWNAHTSSTSILPSNANYWTELEEFDWTVPWAQAGRPVIGRVKAVTGVDPRAEPNTPELETTLEAGGVRFTDLDTNRPWVRYRVRCPLLDGEPWDASASYSVESAERAVWGLDLSEEGPAAAASWSSGVYDIAEGAEGGTVSGLDLDFTPSTAIVTVQKPEGGLNLTASVVDGTLSADGFEFTLSGMTDSDGYKLSYLLLA